MKRKILSQDKPKVIIFFVAFWILLSIASYQLVVKVRHNRFDFYPRWIGSQAILQGESPYSDEVAERIQIGMFDRRLGVDEDQQKFAYMPLIAFQLLPFWLLPFPLAVSLWMGLQLTLLLFLPIAIWKIVNWQPSLPHFSGLIIVSIILFRYPINSYLIGQFIPFCLASLVLAWWGISNQSHTVTSVGLFLSLIRPEVVFIPVIFLLIVSWETFGFRVIMNLTISLSVIWGLTRGMIGAWEVDYLKGLFSYNAYSAPVWPPLLTSSSILSMLLILTILLWSVWMSLNVLDFPLIKKVGWLLSISIIFSLLTLPQTGNYTLILSLLTVWFIVGLPGKRVSYSLVFAAILSLPWMFHLLPQDLSALEHLVVPLLLGCVLTVKYYSGPSSNLSSTNKNLAMPNPRST